MDNQKKPVGSSLSTFKSLVQRQRVLVTWVILPVIILLIAFLVAFLFMKKDNHSSSSTPPVAFKNVLTPTSELKVGDFRYVSPCQVFPLSAATDIFYKTNEKSIVMEDAMAVSVPKSEDDTTVRTRCTYWLAGGTVDIEAEQHSSPEVLKEVSRLVFVTDKDKLDTLMASLKQKAKDSNNSDAKELVSKIETSLAKYKKYEDEYDAKVLSKVSFDGLVLPAFLNYLQVAYGNVAYTLDMFKLDKASAEDLAKLNRIVKVIATNAQNKKLDQSPAPTILGNRDTIGSTKILEPCAVVTTDIFKAITGTNENDLMRRTTLPLDSNRDIIDKKVNKRVLFSNTCTRNSDVGADKPSVDLQLYQGKNVAHAQQYVKDFDDDPSGAPTAIQTTADEAFVYPNSLDPDSPMYLFRVGPYVGIVRIDTLHSAGLADPITTTQASQEQYIQAINLLVDQIKKIQ